MGRETLTRRRLGAPVRAGAVTIFPLERLEVSVAWERHRLVATGAKRAEGVVVLDGRGVRALDVSGAALDLDDVALRFAGLREML